VGGQGHVGQGGWGRGGVEISMNKDYSLFRTSKRCRHYIQGMIFSASNYSMFYAVKTYGTILL
jgi:hypothetical protein